MNRIEERWECLFGQHCPFKLELLKLYLVFTFGLINQVSAPILCEANQLRETLLIILSGQTRATVQLRAFSTETGVASELTDVYFSNVPIDDPYVKLYRFLIYISNDIVQK